MPNVSGLKEKFAELPETIETALKDQIEKEAGKIVAFMRALLMAQPYDIKDKIEIDWTWGDVPEGAVTVAEYRGKERLELVAKIYARGKQGSGIAAQWFEFGTKRRSTKLGRDRGSISASPFFFPAYRAEKSRANNNIRAALRRAIKKLNS